MSVTNFQVRGSIISEGWVKVGTNHAHIKSVLIPNGGIMPPRTKRTIFLRLSQFICAVPTIALASWFVSQRIYLDSNVWAVAISGFSLICQALSYVWPLCPPSIWGVLEFIQILVWIGLTIYRGYYTEGTCKQFFVATSGYIPNPLRNDDDYVITPLGQQLCDMDQALVAISAYASSLYILSFVLYIINVWLPVMKHIGVRGTFKSQPVDLGQLFLSDAFYENRLTPEEKCEDIDGIEYRP